MATEHKDKGLDKSLDRLKKNLEPLGKDLKEAKNKDVKRTEQKKGTLHWVFIMGVWIASLLYLLSAITWVWHEIGPSYFHWITDEQKIESIKDLVLFVAISLLVGELKGFYKKINNNN